MSFETVKDEVVAEIHALVAKLEALFHKAKAVEAEPAVVAPASPAPAVEAAEAPKAVAPEAPPSNPILDAYIHSNPQYRDTSGGGGPSMEEVSAPDVLNWVDGGNLQVGQTAFGAGIYLKGSCTKTIQGLPSVPLKGSVYIDTGRKGGPFTMTVNGAEQPFHTPQQDVTGFFNCEGPTVVVSIQQDADSTMLVALQRA
jgi:hypothetical protein